MLSKTKKKIIAIICVILTVLPILVGCSALPDSLKSRQLCEQFVEYVIEDDSDAAYDMVKNICTWEEFRGLWSTMRFPLKYADSFELKQTSWYKSIENGHSLTEVNFEITTDNDKVCQITIVTSNMMEGIYGIHFLDSTSFVKSTSFVPVIDVIMIVFSIALFAFVVWMFVDCMKRKMKKKVLWAFIILAYGGFSITFGATLGFYAELSLLFGLSRIVADRTALAVTAKVLLPIGAIIYFFVRKRLTVTPPTAEDMSAQPEKSAATTDNSTAPEASADDNGDSNDTESV